MARTEILVVLENERGTAIGTAYYDTKEKDLVGGTIDTGRSKIDLAKLDF